MTCLWWQIWRCSLQLCLPCVLPDLLTPTFWSMDCITWLPGTQTPSTASWFTCGEWAVTECWSRFWGCPSDRKNTSLSTLITVWQNGRHKGLLIIFCGQHLGCSLRSPRGGCYLPEVTKWCCSWSRPHRASPRLKRTSFQGTLFKFCKEVTQIRRGMMVSRN